MRPELRRAYDRAYDPARTARYREDLTRTVGTEPGFRIAETPLFLDPRFFARAREAATAILAQLERPSLVDELARAVPARFAVPNRDRLPEVAVVDFAVTRLEDGSLAPRLVELQGFPSLFAFEAMQGEAWLRALADVDGCAGPWRYADDGFEGLLALLRATILGDADPAEVVLMDVRPERQKTACDFLATTTLLGIAAVDPEDLERRGDALFRRDANGRRIRVRRIYNRLIFEELERAGRALPWDVRDLEDLRWVPHPDWYFMWSKVAIPSLDHASVPRTRLVADADPDADPRGLVLKPLFSFAGGGVVLHPTRADLAAIPGPARRDWCLQERIVYDDVLATPHGEGVKAEVRLMYLRPRADGPLVYATNLCRLSRGAMIGVDYNRDLPWTGSSIGLFEADARARS